MARTWRQSVIVSHGGNHGPKGHTFHKGTTVTPVASQVIPDAVLGQSTEVPQPPEQPTPRQPVACDPPAVKQLLKASREAKPVPVEESVQGPQEEPAAKEPEVTDPASKRELYLMRVSEVEVVAARHGIVVDEGTTGRTKMLRELIATKLSL